MSAKWEPQKATLLPFRRRRFTWPAAQVRKSSAFLRLDGGSGSLSTIPAEPVMGGESPIKQLKTWVRRSWDSENGLLLSMPHVLYGYCCDRVLLMMFYGNERDAPLPAGFPTRDSLTFRLSAQPRNSHTQGRALVLVGTFCDRKLCKCVAKQRHVLVDE